MFLENLFLKKPEKNPIGWIQCCR